MKIIFASAVGLFALTAAAGFVLVASHSQEKRTSLQALVVPGPVHDMSTPPAIKSVPETQRTPLARPTPLVDHDPVEVEPTLRPVARPIPVEDDNGTAEATVRRTAARTPTPARKRAAPVPAPLPERAIARQPSGLSIERANLSSGVFR